MGIGNTAKNIAAQINKSKIIVAFVEEGERMRLKTVQTRATSQFYL